MSENDVSVGLEELSRELAGLVVSELVRPAADTIAVRFTDGSLLAIRPGGDSFEAILTRPPPTAEPRSGKGRPTRRQQEYLDFIKRYMHRFGASPSEGDIQQHFWVSAPSVNQMVRTLERRGFIERDRDWSGQTVPRSIRVVWDG
jgi:hypothetical protein